MSYELTKSIRSERPQRYFSVKDRFGVDGNFPKHLLPDFPLNLWVTKSADAATLASWPYGLTTAFHIAKLFYRIKCHCEIKTQRGLTLKNTIFIRITLQYVVSKIYVAAQVPTIGTLYSIHTRIRRGPSFWILWFFGSNWIRKVLSFIFNIM